MRGYDFLLFLGYGEQVQNLNTLFHPKHLDQALDGFGRHIFLLIGSYFQTRYDRMNAKPAFLQGFSLNSDLATSGVASTAPLALP
jgi:hypothetical protein